MKARADALLLALALASAVVLAAVLWAWGLPLSNDGPSHVFAAWVHNHYADPALAYPEHYVLTSPATSRGFVEVQRVLEPLFGWRTAWRLNVLLACELWALAYFAFVLALDPKKRVAALLGFPFALQTSVWFGLMPFVYASALAFVALALWLCAPRTQQTRAALLGPDVPSVRAHALLALLLFASAGVHVFPAVVAGVALAAMTVARVPRRALPRAAFVLALVGAPAIAVAMQSLGSVAGDAADPTWRTLDERFLYIARWFQAGPWWRPAAALALAISGIVAAALAARARRVRPEVTALVALSVVAMAATLVLPEDFGGWQLAGARLAPFGIGWAAACAPVDARSKLVRTLATVAVGAYASASFAWAWAWHAELREENAPALAALDLSPRPRTWDSIVLRNDRAPVSRFAPLLHIGQLYGLALGGGALYGHDTIPSVHHLRSLAPYVAPRIDLWVDAVRRPETRAAALRRLLEAASEHDGLVLVGDRTDMEAAHSAGWTADFENDDVFIGKFVGCRGSVQIIDAPASVAVEVGWWPLRTASQTFQYGPGPGVPDTIALAPIGCGDLWIRVLGKSGEHCAGTEPGQVLRGTFVDGADDDNVLACVVER